MLYKYNHFLTLSTCFLSMISCLSFTNFVNNVLIIISNLVVYVVWLEKSKLCLYEIQFLNPEAKYGRYHTVFNL